MSNGSPASLAADIYPTDGDWNRLHEAAIEFGLHFPIRSPNPEKDEPWHCQPNEVPSGEFAGLPSGWDLN